MNARGEITESFVLSLPRTGSTLLRLLLDTHCEVFAPDELRLGRLCSALFATLEGLAESSSLDAGRQTDLAASPLALEQTRELVRTRMADATRTRGKRVWCEKSPENLLYRKVLEQVFPAARYVLLHRHCLDFVSSCLRTSPFGFNLPILGHYLAGHHQSFVPPLVRAWVEHTSALLAFEREKPEPCLRLRYEDLVVDPHLALRSLSELLGIGDDPQAVERVFAARHHQRLRAGDGNAVFSSRIVTSNLGRGREIPWSEIAALPDDLTTAMNEQLQILGYPPVEHEGWAATTITTTGERKEPAAAEVTAAAIRTLFEQSLPSRLAAEPPPALRGKSFCFKLGDGGSWTLDCRGERGAVVAGTSDEACEIRLSSRLLLEIASGATNPAVAHREGHIAITGHLDIDALRALSALLMG